MALDALNLVPGMLTTRDAVRAAYGGRTQRGISSSGTTPNVFLYSDHGSAAEHGYDFDGWAEDDEVYHYTGEGPSGDQELVDGNKAILEHANPKKPRALHVFVGEGRKGSSGPVIQRYIGEFTLDLDEPYLERWNVGQDGRDRKVFVFRLRPVADARFHRVVKDRTPKATKNTRIKLPAKATSARLIAPEQNKTPETSYEAQGGTRKVTRWESGLSDAFLAHLEGLGHDVGRYQLTVKGSRAPLYTDLYDATDDVLYEAKSKHDRPYVRMAVGQILDYQRHIGSDSVRLGIVLPAEPEEDVRAYTEGLGIHLVIQNGDKFEGYPLS
ncbi:hypothetical protein [Kitasatospora sp. NBC_01302]|uniref:hypothetical protein n=1 Tax=Kitasatospora sp. NBC_01302 TaxID=2903575 RepID=UPI002E0F7106|nr:hypothetical protein OG294_18775 [Kitasatospora sp. NBC_01302]